MILNSNSRFARIKTTTADRVMDMAFFKRTEGLGASMLSCNALDSTARSFNQESHLSENKVRGAFYLNEPTSVVAPKRGGNQMGSKKMEREQELVEVDKRLAEWAKWAKTHRQALGYPTISSLFRVMMDSRRKKLSDTIFPPTAQGKEKKNFRDTESHFIPERIAEVDSAVAKLPRMLERVITANYFTYGPIEVRAKSIGLKRGRFSQYLEAAKYSMSVLLDVRNFSSDLARTTTTANRVMDVA